MGATGPAPIPYPHLRRARGGPRNYQHAQYARGTALLIQDLQRAVRYPAAALRAHISGTVRVAFTVEPSGAVDDIRIVSSPSPLLNEGVVQAVQQLGLFRDEPGEPAGNGPPPSRIACARTKRGFWWQQNSATDVPSWLVDVRRM